jgi:hypothetical protein
MPRTQRRRPVVSRLIAVFTCAAALALAPAAAFGDDDGGRLRVHISGEDGDRLDLDLSLGWVAALVDWADVECEAETDRRTRRMAQSLDRQGEGGVYEFVDDDGEEVVARRVEGTLRIESREKRGEHAKVEIPWPLAECLLLGREPDGGLARALERGNFRVRIEGEDGKVTIDVD